MQILAKYYDYKGPALWIAVALMCKDFLVFTCKHSLDGLLHTNPILIVM